MTAFTSRHFMPGRAEIWRTGRHLRPALMIATLAGITVGVGAPAQATSVTPTVAVNGVGYSGATLKTGGIYTVQVNLNPRASADFGRLNGQTTYCGGDRQQTPHYCVSDVRSHLVGAPVISDLTLDGVDLSDAATVSGDTLSFLDGSYIPATHVINFTETFSEAREAFTYFYGNKNPALDGYSPDANVYAILIPGSFGGSLLSCGFSGSVNHGSSLANSLFNTVAACSLKLTYAFPDTPTPTPTPTPPPVSGVPEPMTWAMMVMGFGAIGVAMRRKAFSPLTPEPCRR